MERHPCRAVLLNATGGEFVQDGEIFVLGARDLYEGSSFLFLKTVAKASLPLYPLKKANVYYTP